MSIDKTFHNWMTARWGKNNLRDSFWSLVTLYGVWVLFLLGVANLFISSSSDNVWLLFRQSAMGVSVAWTLMICISYTIRRTRPFKERGEKALVKMWLETPSFPSGHTTLAFALATAIYLSAGVLSLQVALSFVLAIAIAYSRLYVGVHYVSDVLAGAILGSGIVWIFFA